MANNPVQIVLNDNDYVVPPEPKKGGPPYDFFAGKDADFAKHKAKLADQVQLSASRLDQKATGGVGYIQVRLRDRALAKTHRPIRALLTPDKFPCVGASGLGELYYFAGAADLAELEKTISEAELKTRWVQGKSGKPEARPSPIRSDVGAIEDISIPDPIRKPQCNGYPTLAPGAST